MTGIDVSPKAIELAEKRAELSGIAGSTRFLCSPLETVDLPAASFDVIWGDAILHHLLAELDWVLPKLAAWTKPDGLMLFAEPVNYNATLRRLRFMVPVNREATPDERPLEASEFELLKRYMTDIRIERFTLLCRLDRFGFFRTTTMSGRRWRGARWRIYDSRRSIMQFCARPDSAAWRGMR